MKSADQLTKMVNKFIEFFPHSRIHKLRTFDNKANGWFVKRDDELSFGISGSKLRKYSSLLPILRTHLIEEAILIGGPYSNHILSLTQLLIENGINPTLFLLKNRASLPPIGNYLLLSLFISESQIRWIPEEKWPQINQIVENYMLQNTNKKAYIIPQGAFMPEALPGALTLPLDIISNEEGLGEEFSNIFIEAGTGFSAIALILAFAWLGKRTIINVILLADMPQEFIQKLEDCRKAFNRLFSQNLSLYKIQRQFKIHKPTIASSFGSTNTHIFKEIIHIARQEGFLTDPIYSAKLFLTSRHIFNSQSIEGPVLLIHSGGGLTLMGFERQLQQVLKREGYDFTN